MRSGSCGSLDRGSNVWCSSCRADVAAELAADNRRVICTRCGLELRQAASHGPFVTPPRTVDSERDARELLARWSADSLTVPALALPRVEQVSRPVIDTADSGPHSTPASEEAVEPADTATVALPMVRRRQRRRDSSAMVPPVSPPPKSSRWAAIAGHLAAYAGVGLLTGGTTLIIWSYFGGPPAYAPTGWLLATIGQMVLYLGVVTLVASGLEQTTDAVHRQMAQLSAQLQRLEAAQARRPRRRDAA